MSFGKVGESGLLRLRSQDLWSDGAVVGAAVEAGSQVIGSMATGQSFSDAVNGIDYADVGIAAIEYGVAGLTNGASLAVVGVVSDVAKAAIDIKSGIGVETVLNGSKDGATAAVELVVGKVAGDVLGGVSSKVSSKVGSATKELIDNASKKLDDAFSSASNLGSKTAAKDLKIPMIILFFSCSGPYIPKEKRIYVKAEVVKIFHHNSGAVKMKYRDLSQKEYISQANNKIDELCVGEKYFIAYDKSNPSEISVFFTAPIIEDSTKYIKSSAIITWNLERSYFNSNDCRFKYTYNGVRYKRYQKLVDKKVKKGDVIDIWINKNKPNIAYVDGNSAVTK